MTFEKYSYRVSSQDFLTGLLRAEESIRAMLECTPNAIIESNLKLALRELQRSITNVRDSQQAEVDRKVKAWRDSL